jgi:MT0933-like antitoxin protein
MGFMDKLKGLFGGHKQQIDQGIDKAADAVKQKVPDEHVDKVDSVADKAHEVVDNLADKTPADSAPAAPADAAPPDSAPAAPVDPEPAS